MRFSRSARIFGGFGARGPSRVSTFVPSSDVSGSDRVQRLPIIEVVQHPICGVGKTLLSMLPLFTGDFPAIAAKGPAAETFKTRRRSLKPIGDTIRGGRYCCCGCGTKFQFRGRSRTSLHCFIFYRLALAHFFGPPVPLTNGGDVGGGAGKHNYRNHEKC